MQHLDDGLIHELVDGEVESARLTPIQQHLAECASCRTRLDEARDAAGFADSLLELLDPEEVVDDPQVIPIDQRRRSHWSRNLAWAASLILAVGLGYVGRGEFLPAPPPAALTQAAADVSTTAAEPGVPAEAPTPPPATTSPAREEQRTTASGAVSRRDDTPEPAAPAPDREAEAAPAAPPRDRAAPRVAVAINTFEDASISTRAPAPEFGAQLSAGAAAKAMETATIVVDLPAAMAALGGSIRLIDGLVPERLERLGDTVTVIYRALGMTLGLRQHPIGTDLSWSLDAPARFPADSLAVLRARVK